MGKDPPRLYAIACFNKWLAVPGPSCLTSFASFPRVEAPTAADFKLPE